MTANEDQIDELATLAPTIAIGGLIAGKYRVERLLGKGGMGLVIAARHMDLDRPVAIKVVRAELAQEERVLQRFLFEARSAAKIISEHVCQVIDVGRLDNGLPFIVMEMLEGRDLGRLLAERGRIDPVDCVDWILQVCDGLAQAHAAGIVHRDLKPENLLLTVVDGVPCVKILDFGISKQIGIDRSFTEPNGIVGSPRYMAPEQLLGGTVDERSDLWAIGAIAYELITGVPAFSGDTVASICAKVIGDAPRLPRHLVPNIPAGLDQVILACLRRDPAARFRDASSLARALVPFASERGGQSYQRSAAMPRSRRASLGDRRTVPVLIEPANDLPEPAPAPPRRRARSALALLVALVSAAYGGVRWLAHPSAGASSSAIAGPVASAPQIAPVPGANEPRAPLPLAGAAATAVSAVMPGAPREPSASAEPSRGSSRPRAERAPTVELHALRPAAATKPARASPDNPESDPAAHVSSAHSKLQEAWDVANFGGRE